MEETESPGPRGLGAEAAGATGVDPVAAALTVNGASREKADAFLDDQRRMVRLQIERMEAQEPHLREEEHLRLAQHRLETSHMRIRRFGDYAKMALEISVGLLVLALVAGISLMVWNAAHADGLVIESFSVPPDMASKGIGGQVVASQLLDKLTVIQNRSTSVRPAKSYVNSWGDDLKVEIPDTGVSVGEAYRFLRGWLGHETHVRGEIIRTATGIVITTRIGTDGSVSFVGPESDLDALVQKSAEQVFRVIQPDR